MPIARLSRTIKLLPVISVAIEIRSAEQRITGFCADVDLLVALAEPS